MAVLLVKSLIGLGTERMLTIEGLMKEHSSTFFVKVLPHSCDYRELAMRMAPQHTWVHGCDCTKATRIAKSTKLHVVFQNCKKGTHMLIVVEDAQGRSVPPRVGGA